MLDGAEKWFRDGLYPAKEKEAGTLQVARKKQISVCERVGNIAVFLLKHATGLLE